MKPTVKSSGSEICEARRALDSLGHERPKRAALPESRESETCCEAPGRVNAAAVESGVRRTDERFCGTESSRSDWTTQLHRSARSSLSWSRTESCQPIHGWR